MIGDIYSYSRKVVRPQVKSIVSSSEFWIAMIIGVIAGLCGGRIIPTTTTTSNVAMAFLTYASIALGFALAGLTLTLTLPNEGFVKLLATTRSEPGRPDTYTNLLFIFSWTAIIHWILVIVTVILVLFVKPDQPAFEIDHHQIQSGIVAAFSAYCLFQFLLTLITLAHVGSVYTNHIQGKFEKEKQPECKPKPDPPKPG
jgi:hypothetical protein